MLRSILMAVCLVPAIVLCDECQQVPVKPELDLKQMTGWWFIKYTSKVHKGYKDEFKCMATYFADPISEGRTKLVSTVLPGSGPRSSEGASFLVNVIHNTTDGNMFYEMWTKGNKVEIPTRVIDTDYKTYLIMNFCFAGWDGNWLYTRVPRDPTEDELKLIEGGLQTAKWTIDDFKPTTMNVEECP